MPTVSTLLARVAKIEQVRAPKPSRIAVALGGIDAFEAAAMNGIAEGRLDEWDVRAILKILRDWCEQDFGRR